MIITKITQYGEQMKYDIINGNNIDILKTFPDNYFDSIVTDPPYGINFLGKEWDNNVGTLETYKECLRVLKPGGHILAFSAARTYHHLAMVIEEAGFEIRDQIMWIYGSGFPKSQDIGKNNNLPEWKGWGTQLKPAHEPICMARKPFKGSVYKNVQEYGTGAINIDECRVPFNKDDHVLQYEKYSDGSYKSTHANATSYNFGNQVSINPIGRFPANIIHDGSDEVKSLFPNSLGAGGSIPKTTVTGYGEFGGGSSTYTPNERTEFDSGSGSAARFFYEVKQESKGRFPANVIHDGSDEVTQHFPYSTSGARKPEHNIKGLEDGSQREIFGSDATSGKYNVQPFEYAEADEGSAARFFYCPKVNNKERHLGFPPNSKGPMIDANTHGKTPFCEDCNKTINGTNDHSKCDPAKQTFKEKRNSDAPPGNNHPTVKPVELMKYLIKLVTPKNGRVLDPFNGSGSTGMAAVSLGHEYVGIELDANYVEISKKRIEAYNDNGFNELFEVNK